MAGEEITITHELSAGAPRPRDDLDVALDALQPDGAARVRVRDGALTLAEDTGAADADAPADAGAASPHDLAVLGCRRIVELVHNEQRHKLEAAQRGAIPLVTALYETHAGAHAVEAHASRALRALCFRNDVARHLVSETVAIARLVAALSRSLDALEAAPAAPAVAAAVTGQGVGVAAVAPPPDARALALMVADEALTTLSLLVHRHTVNGQLAVDAGALVQASRAAALLAVEPAAAAAGASAPGAGRTSSAPPGVTAGDVGRKAAMLQVLLG